MNDRAPANENNEQLSQVSCESTFAIDNEPPIVSFIAPTDGDTVREIVQLLANTFDIHGYVQRVEYYYSEDNIEYTLINIATQMPYVVNWNTANLEPRQYYLKVLAKDIYGLEAQNTIIVNVTDKPTVKNRKEIMNSLLESIALEEAALSYLIKAEAEKTQWALGRLPQKPKPKLNTKEILEIQKQVEKVMRTAIKFQMLLQFKLEDVLKAMKEIETTLTAEGK